MEKIEKVVSLPKEWSEVGDALVGVAVAVKAAKADGWQPGTDIPAVLMASFGPLAKALEGAQNLPVEAKESPAGAIKALALAGADALEALK